MSSSILQFQPKFYDGNRFASAHELVEKNGVFYQRYSKFEFAGSWSPCVQQWNDWKADAPYDGDYSYLWGVESLWFIGM
ncbi:hypothetical protein DPMN_149703 [Dreissena polymorpha]|uniref:Uncharacterized protein n=1 Tax=Dreissena polymorpha TaxID=45954 RepID=A0A9D4FGB9_DREPO|nr:hypothetical protein DPMN_149703 [Dreissena polymorpha]